ncbi:hypothetical protein [Cellulomonas sp. URHE0023]|uniref:hypothetical protein n=1 Tax=Cellulomonas sp. URHE0023 TaxID=1380354 RepID=UPI000558D07D|nr:hypothetical protein [Cellulomonas sp. URHE0023]
MAVLELSERWWGLGDGMDPLAVAKRAAVGVELSKEIAPGHLLHGRIDRIEASFEASDDVIVRLSDGTFALVHPTWSGRQESPSFPTSRLLGEAEAASVAILEWEQDW